jgi:hypothetical protein
MESRLSLVTCMISTSVLLLSSSTKKKLFYRFLGIKTKSPTRNRIFFLFPSAVDRHRFDADPDPDTIVTKFYTSWKISRKKLYFTVFLAITVLRPAVTLLSYPVLLINIFNGYILSDSYPAFFLLIATTSNKNF